MTSAPPNTVASATVRLPGWLPFAVRFCRCRDGLVGDLDSAQDDHSFLCNDVADWSYAVEAIRGECARLLPGSSLS